MTAAAALIVIPSPGGAPDTTWSGRTVLWAEPEEVHVAAPPRRLRFLRVVPWKDGRWSGMQTASDEVQRRLRLDDVDLDRAGLRLQKDYGRRLSLVTTTGLGSAAEDALEADYRLWGGWYVRSETRERGETFMELRREIHFR